MMQLTCVVIQGKFKASLESSGVMKMAKYIEQLMHRSSEYITSCLSRCPTKQSDSSTYSLLAYMYVMPCPCVAIHSYSLASLVPKPLPCFQCIGSKSPDLAGDLPISRHFSGFLPLSCFWCAISRFCTIIAGSLISGRPRPFAHAQCTIMTQQWRIQRGIPGSHGSPLLAGPSTNKY